MSKAIPQAQPAPEPEPAFQPTKALYVERHSMLAKSIRIYDITSLATTTPYEGTAFRAHACAVGQSAADAGEPATWTLHRPQRRRRLFRLLAGDHSAAIASGGGGDSSADANPDGGAGAEVAAATWREPVSDFRDVSIDFAPLANGGAAPHCEHPVTVHTKSRLRHWERFVVESAEFVWRHRPFSEPKWVLEKWSAGGRRTVVAQFWCPRWWLKHSGALAVDTREVDHVVALLTWYVVARKIQRRK
jgi:hypothetical protein